MKPRLVLLAALLLAIAYAYPGYMNWDSGSQLFESRHGTFGDWHPPMMAAYWWVLEHVARGPFPMLLLQLGLFTWGIHGFLKTWLAPARAAWVTALVLLFPPVLTPMACVWKDAQMAGFLAAGTALALRPSRRARSAGIAMLVLACAVRDNAPAALPPLCLWFVASWGLRTRVRTVIAAAALSLAIVLVAMGANAAMRTTRQYAWYNTVAIHDLAGTICYADPLSDDEVRELLEGIEVIAMPPVFLQSKFCREYSPRVWFGLVFAGGPAHNVFHQLSPPAERPARRAAWLRVVREHPGAYLTHRWAVMRQVLGLTAEPPWEPVPQDFAATPEHLRRLHHDASRSWLQKRAHQVFGAFAKTVAYRPWAYALLALVFLGWSVFRREWPIAALLGSGLLYEAGYFFVAASPDFRYSHWLVLCTCIGAIATATRVRARAVESTRSQPPV